MRKTNIIERYQEWEIRKEWTEQFTFQGLLVGNVEYRPIDPKGTPMQGMGFRTLEEAREYIDKQEGAR